MFKLSDNDISYRFIFKFFVFSNSIYTINVLNNEFIKFNGIFSYYPN